MGRDEDTEIGSPQGEHGLLIGPCTLRGHQVWYKKEPNMSDDRKLMRFVVMC